MKTRVTPLMFHNKTTAEYRACSLAGLFCALTFAAHAQQPGSNSSMDASAANRPQEIKITFPRTIVAEVFSGRIARIGDGGTLIVERDGGTEHTRLVPVRLFGLARTPAASTPSTSPDGSELARRYLTDNLIGKQVRVEGRGRSTDGIVDAVVSEEHHAPSRVVQPMRSLEDTQLGQSASVLDTGTSQQPAPVTPLNVLLVRLGLSNFDPSIKRADPDLAKQLADAQDGARRDKNGLWATVGAQSNGGASSAELPKTAGDGKR